MPLDDLTRANLHALFDLAGRQVALEAQVTELRARVDAIHRAREMEN
jgi:hypothetical protein